MKNIDERMESIFEKAKKEKRRRQKNRRTAIVITLSLICVFTTVATAIGRERETDPITFIPSLYDAPTPSETTAAPTSLAASGSESSKLEEESSLPKTEPAPSLSKPAEAPSSAEETIVATDAPITTVPEKTEKQPPQKLPAQTTVQTEPTETAVPSAVAPAVPQTSEDESTASKDIPTLPVSEKTDEATDAVSITTDLNDKPMLGAPETKEKPRILSENEIENAVKNLATLDDSGADADSIFSGIFDQLFGEKDSPQVKNQVFVSQSLLDQANGEELVKSRVTIFFSTKEEGRKFLEKNTTSFLASENGFLAFLTLEQLQAFDCKNLSENALVFFAIAK